MRGSTARELRQAARQFVQGQIAIPEGDDGRTAAHWGGLAYKTWKRDLKTLPAQHRRLYLDRLWVRIGGKR